jgi:hypothetical protein
MGAEHKHPIKERIATSVKESSGCKRRRTLRWKEQTFQGRRELEATRESGWLSPLGQ